MTNTEIKILKYLVKNYEKIILNSKLQEKFKLNINEINTILWELKDRNYIEIHGFDNNAMALLKAKDYFMDKKIDSYKKVLNVLIFSITIPILVAFITASLVSSFINNKPNSNQRSNNTQNKTVNQSK